MDWAFVALLLLVVGFVSAALAIFVFVWAEYMNAYEYAWGLVVTIFGIVAVITLSSSYVIINKKL